MNENGTNWTPIYYATICQSKEIVKFLSSLTKSPNAADINEWTPIHAASAFGFLDIVELLVPTYGYRWSATCCYRNSKNLVS